MASMPRVFHSEEEQLSPAPLFRRLLAMLYDGLICAAVLLVTTLIYTIISAWITGFERYKMLSESGATGGDPLLTSLLFVTLFVFFGYFWTRNGQTLGMQVWRIRVENRNGTAIRWPQALLRFLVGWIGLLAGGLGYLWMLWDSEKRCWTDMASESVAVRVPDSRP